MIDPVGCIFTNRFSSTSPTRLLVLNDMHSEPANQYSPLKEQRSGGEFHHMAKCESVPHHKSIRT